MTQVLLEDRGVEGIETLEGYLASGGFRALRRALSMTPAEVITEIKESGLRGRGGAGFPTGMKWGFVPTDTGKPVYLCVNADEAEPGTCKDRVLMEELPFHSLEGSMIAAYAIGSNMAFWYIRGEFDLSERRIRDSIAALYSAGWLGKNIQGLGFDLEFFIHRGAGAYICGEETGLISSLEGGQGYPKLKPPFPAIKGAFGCPTIVNNVESLAAVPWIMNHGAAAYGAMGTEKSRGTKLLSVSGPVKRPGVYEVPLGLPIRELIDDLCGGMQDGKTLKAIIPGGSSTPILPADVAMSVSLDYEALAEVGTMLGSGGVIVIDEGQSMPELLAILGRFYAHESCGQCTPCREGTGWAARLLTRIADGEGTLHDLETLKRISGFLRGTTICPLADALAMPIQSFFTHFMDEFEAALADAEPVGEMA